MSAATEGSPPRLPAKGKPVTLSSLAEKKALGEPIAMVTAYDYPSAGVAEEAGVDVVLVGDSAAMTVLGYPSTVPVSVEEMLMLAAAARRGLRTPLLVGDLPFGSYEVSDEQAVATAQRFVKEAGCDAVKLERGGSSVARARAIAAAGIPVMGHVGLTPQTATALGGYRSQGRTAERALEVVEDALALEEAGCFSIVFEAIPADVTDLVMPRLTVPVIGIGAGPATDGQVLVFHDLLGIYDGHAARFVKRYANVREQMVAGVHAFAEDVRGRRYPEPDHGYTMAPDERERLREMLERDRGTATEQDLAGWGRTTLGGQRRRISHEAFRQAPVACSRHLLHLTVRSARRRVVRRRHRRDRRPRDQERKRPRHRREEPKPHRQRRGRRPASAGARSRSPPSAR